MSSEWGVPSNETTYVISLPPLSLGDFQERVTLEEVISSYSRGASGGEGRSVKNYLYKYVLIC